MSIVSEAAAARWVAGAARGLPVDREKPWDGAAAARSVLDGARIGGERPDHALAARAFLVHDAAAPDERSSYKLPIAELRGGKLVALASGIRAAASRLPQTKGLPPETAGAARALLDSYEPGARARAMAGGAAAALARQFPGRAK